MELLLDAYLAFGLMLGAGLIALVGLGVSYLAKKIKWNSIRALTNEAWEIVAVVARDANAELHARLKAAKEEDSPGGAEVTDAEWKAAKKAALAKAKELIGLENLGRLAKALGLDSGLLDQWLGSQIGAEMPLPADPL
jgi:hypothetical protein